MGLLAFVAILYTKKAIQIKCLLLCQLCYDVHQKARNGYDCNKYSIALCELESSCNNTKFKFDCVLLYEFEVTSL